MHLPADDCQLRPPVLRPAFRAGIIGYGLGISIAFGRQPGGGYSPGDQVGSNGLCPVLRQRDILGCLAGIIGMTVDLDLKGRVVFHQLYYFIQLGSGFGF